MKIYPCSVCIKSHHLRISQVGDVWCPEGEAEVGSASHGRKSSSWRTPPYSHSLRSVTGVQVHRDWQKQFESSAGFSLLSATPTPRSQSGATDSPIQELELM